MNLKLFSRLLTVAAPLFALFGSAWAMQGAVWTTYADGTQPNGNTFPAKAAVYLNGGPQNDNGPGLDDGVYYFEVTDPSGSTLLSTDFAVNRRIIVVNGNIYGVGNYYLAHGGSSPYFGKNLPVGNHLEGGFNSLNNTIPVKLMPFSTTPNTGGEYKVTIVPIDHATVAADGKHLNIDNGFTKSDNFKVLPDQRTRPEGTMTIVKYNDQNGNGGLDAGEPLRDGFQFTVTVYNGLTTSDPLLDHFPITVTSGDDGAGTGAASFTVPQGAYLIVVHEIQQAGWNQTQPSLLADYSGVAPGRAVIGGPDTLPQTLTFGNHFGAATSNVHIVKFNDVNDNLIQDSGEGAPPIAFDFEVTVHSTSDPNSSVLTGFDHLQVSTDADGEVTVGPFASGQGGNYVEVHEINIPTGWHNSLPGDAANNQIDVTVNSGETATVTFGNYHTTENTLIVSKYNDLDQNGANNGEPQLDGVQFDVEYWINDGAHSHLTMTSGDDGVGTGTSTHTWTLRDDQTLHYTVTEIVPTGWHMTEHSNDSGDLSGGTTTTATFGDWARVYVVLHKYWDSDKSGSMASDELPIAGIRFNLSWSVNGGATENYNPYLVSNANGDAGWSLPLMNIGDTVAYTLTEILPTLPNNQWVITEGAAGYSGTLSADQTGGGRFGDYMRASGGLTLGFWSNKNGAGVLGSDDPAWASFLTGLNLAKGNPGVAWDPTGGPTGIKAFQTVLLNATATNMAYMLSAQLATTELDVRESGLQPNKYKNYSGGNVLQGSFQVFVPNSAMVSGGSIVTLLSGQNGFNVVTGGGWITIADLMADANTDLAMTGHQTTTASGSVRNVQDAMKTLLDMINNNNGSLSYLPAPPYYL